MTRSDIDAALELLNELVERINHMIDYAGFIPSGELIACLDRYEELVNNCMPVPYEVVSDD